MRCLLFLTIFPLAILAVPERAVVTSVGYSPQLTYASNSTGLFPNFELSAGYKIMRHHILLGFNGQTSVRPATYTNAPGTQVLTLLLEYKRTVYSVHDWEFQFGGEVGMAARQHGDFIVDKKFPTYLGAEIQPKIAVQYYFVDSQQVGFAIGAYAKIGGRMFSEIPSEFTFSFGLSLTTMLDLF